MGSRLEGSGEVVLVTFGDGATSAGDWHEAMNFAGVFKAPVIFLCQNNYWAISVPLPRQTAGRIADRAAGYGFPGIRIDGNDVLAVFAATRAAAERARRGDGPYLIEAQTYRMGAHTSSDDPTRYRTAAELEAWSSKDPIARYERWLRVTGALFVRHACLSLFQPGLVSARWLGSGSVLNSPSCFPPLDTTRINCSWAA